MGSCCSKQEPAAFSQPGRRLDSAALRPTAPTASVPATAKPKVGGPPRTLGGSSSGPGGDADDARRRAAEAAEARNRPSSTGGKLSAQLAAQKKQTHAQTLQEVSDTNRRHRDVEEANEARTYD